MAGQKITIQNGVWQGTDFPIILFIEGDGTGPDILASPVWVLDAAVEMVCHGHRKMARKEVYAGEKSYNQSNAWLPRGTPDTIMEYPVAIKLKCSELGTEIINNM
jgi:isocitrate dehydrogenase